MVAASPQIMFYLRKGMFYLGTKRQNTFHGVWKQMLDVGPTSSPDNDAQELPAHQHNSTSLLLTLH